MLRSINTRSFVECILLLTCLYYVIVLLRYYRKEIKSFWKREKIDKLPETEDKITAPGSSPMESDSARG